MRPFVVRAVGSMARSDNGETQLYLRGLSRAVEPCYGLESEVL
jgi:hypothetical protein